MLPVHNDRHLRESLAVRNTPVRGLSRQQTTPLELQVDAFRRDSDPKVAQFAGDIASLAGRLGHPELKRSLLENGAQIAASGIPGLVPVALSKALQASIQAVPSAEAEKVAEGALEFVARGVPGQLSLAGSSALGTLTSIAALEDWSAVAPAAEPPSFEGVPLLQRLQARFSGDDVAAQRLELKEVEHFQKQFEAFSTPAQFQAQTAKLKELIAQGTPLEKLRPQAYALARVAATQALGKTPYDSQMLGALSMDSGTIAQMGTGEGKTLTALMPLYLNALSGKGSHLVTVNDYLAQTGFDELKPAFELLGVSAGLVLKEMSPDQKRAGYAADITYLSNDTLGFDYLGDRTVRDPRQRVQREPFFALIDEVDQVLLDEARVPLIIAGMQPNEEFQQAVDQGAFFRDIVGALVPGEDFRVDRKIHSAFLTDIGQEVVANEVGLAELSKDDPDYAAKMKAGQELRSVLREEARLTEGERDLPEELQAQRGLKKVWHQLLGRPIKSEQSDRLAELRERKAELQQVFPGADLYAEDQMHRVHYLQNALSARGLFRKDRDYTVENGEVQIIDEFKGRISEGRRFTQGLHQALEIKEGLEPKPETHTIASITYPNLFRRYERLAGMTGTAKQAEKEFTEVLGLKVVDVPPNKERKRVDHPDQVYATMEDKFKAVAARVQELFEQGVPVLVATRSVEMNQYVSALLESQGVPNQSLNAQDVKTNTPEENAIIATAGQSGVVTVATNMAGRGVDIKPDPINYKQLAIACDEARRNGKPIVVQLEKEEHAERLIQWFQLPPDPQDHVPFSRGVAAAAAGVVQIRVGDEVAAPADGATLLKGSDFPGRKLVVVGTERNLDPRIDDQLRGRAGRQGAPGETEFHVSLEDDLMRIYSDTDREKLLKLIENGQQDKLRALVDEAQERVMNAQADARLSTAKYDQVANRQREIVWSFRDAWVESSPELQHRSDDAMDVRTTVNDWMVEAFTAAVEEKLEGKRKPSDERLQQAVDAVSSELKFPLEIPPGKGSWRERVERSLRDKVAQCEADIEKYRGGLPENMVATHSWRSLRESLDEGWTNQLQVLEDEKQGSNLEAYAGKEPEQAYLERSFKAFDEMWKGVKRGVADKVLHQLAEAASALRNQAQA